MAARLSASRRSRSRALSKPETERAALREIGRRIRSARLAADLTQEEAADRARIDYKRWQRLEQGAVNPTARTLLRVAEAVETDLFRLMDQRRQGRRRP